MICLHKKRAHPSLTPSAFCAVLLLACLSLQISAQYQFDVWTTDNGLPQNSVNAILQTRDGYLWLATSDGLVRYDGVRFKVFNRGNTIGIESNRFSALYEDHDGTLWIGTAEDWLTRYQDGIFISHSIKEGAPHGEMLKLEEDTDGNLWITTMTNVFCWKNGQVTVYHPTDLKAALRNGHASGLSNLWWCQDAAGLHYFRQGRIVTYAARDGLPNCNISVVSEAQYGTLWIRTTDAGLMCVKNGRLTRYTVKDGLLSNNAPGAFGDRAGNIWIELNGKLKRLGDEPWSTLPVQGVTTQYEDREGTFWLGGAGGLMRMQQMAVTALTLRDGLFSEWVYTILQDRTGAVWLGSWGGGVSRYQQGKFTHYYNLADFFSLNVTSLYEDRDGTLWVGTQRGVSQLKDGRITRYSDQHGLSEVFGMHQDRVGNMWFATSKGLIRNANGSFTTYTTQDGLSSNDATVLFEDHAGALWIGTRGGITRYANGRFTAWTDGFANSQTRAIYEDRDGVLWIGTYDSGLYRFQDGHITRYTTNEGLFNNGVFQILADARGYFWLSSNLGIYRVRREELNDFAAGKIQAVTSTAYGKKDGLPNLECNGGRQPAGWKMRDGKLWFPTMGGVAIVNPAAVPINALAPPVVIEEFLLDQQPKDFRQGVRLEPGQDHFEIRFTGLSFIKPEQVRFKYRLEGLDTEWIEAGTRRTAYYSYVKPGEYLFQVIAANSDGSWNKEGASLKIIINPPFWRRWWFLTLALLSLIAGVGYAHYLRVTRLKRAKVQQEAYSRRLIETQEAERERIAIGLHSSLNQNLLVVKNRALRGSQLVAEDTPTGTEFAEIETTVSHAITQVREIAHNLRPPILDQFGLTSAIEDMVQKVASATPISFTMRLDELRGLLSKEAEINLFRIVQEGINNILKHSNATAAHVEIKRDARSVGLKISDNGQGFQTAHAGGFGLTDIKERIKVLNGNLTIQSAPGQGTTLLIHFATPTTGKDIRHAS